jgi:hypothetical protein
MPRPIRQRRSEGLGQRILGRRHISRASGEKGDELAVAAARDGICRAKRPLLAVVEDHAFTPLRGSRGHAPDGAHLDDTVAGGRATRRPREGRIEIGHIDEKVATQLLF